ncbi:hypothetical protein [Lentzea cavernae]|uniref:Uncharacterized protein n=1 Tax=Lentzea cavernae TaxID=2020703 RepID=A0ABQ3MTQ1_9PSEU|nr:hypothetical protein [Lentzea cavernae]GHH57428.1 hypothetical protein GCM10017774_76900 [Lentzea cavernae]
MRQARTTAIEHGTSRGFDAHATRGEEPCAGCKQAHTIRSTAARIRRESQDTVRVQAAGLGELLIDCGEEVCHKFGEFFGHEIVAACMDRAAAKAWAEKRSA